MKKPFNLTEFSKRIGALSKEPISDSRRFTAAEMMTEYLDAALEPQNKRMMDVCMRETFLGALSRIQEGEKS